MNLPIYIVTVHENYDTSWCSYLEVVEINNLQASLLTSNYVYLNIVLLICVYAHALDEVQYGICKLKVDKCAGEN
jgi:hypothetical protein